MYRTAIALVIGLMFAPVVCALFLRAREHLIAVQTIRAAARYARPGVLVDDVLRALGEPEAVFDQPVRFARPVRGRLLRYRFGLTTEMYVYVDTSGVVECTLVELS